MQLDTSVGDLIGANDVIGVWIQRTDTKKKSYENPWIGAIH